MQPPRLPSEPDFLCEIVQIINAIVGRQHVVDRHKAVLAGFTGPQDEPEGDRLVAELVRAGVDRGASERAAGALRSLSIRLPLAIPLALTDDETESLAAVEPALTLVLELKATHSATRRRVRSPNAAKPVDVFDLAALLVDPLLRTDSLQLNLVAVEFTSRMADRAGYRAEERVVAHAVKAYAVDATIEQRTASLRRLYEPVKPEQGRATEPATDLDP